MYTPLVDVPNSMSCCMTIELRGLAMIGFGFGCMIIVLETSVRDFILEDRPDVGIGIGIG